MPGASGPGRQRATLGALAALDGHRHAYRVLRTAVSDMRDIKIRRRRRPV
ncbi:hypothetical protein [Nonomuraea sp. NPDC050691]